MTGRTRKLGLAGVLISGTLLFGVGFAGAQTASDGELPKPEPKVSTATITGDLGVHSGGGGCGDGGAATADPAQF
jgi:hypothetical protein